MHILFVHGLGASPIWGAPLLFRLRKAGHSTSNFSYMVSRHDFETVKKRLIKTIENIAQQGEYALVGHSLGGILLRAAVLDLAPEVRRPAKLFLLGSPVTSTLGSRILKDCFLYRLLARDCGQLVSTQRRMKAIGVPPVETICIIGTRGRYGRFSPFGTASNDGMVQEKELCAERFSHAVKVDASHSFLAFSREVAQCAIEHLANCDISSQNIQKS